ncbi:hypothetical protein EII34_06810 [Arachnia propionica]|uniref:Lipoprotein n=1 Tax=Arachnia propionica TaxID=1750 RepID=A0A3P1T9A3_9ACTN|nr:hypothetical protein [Arachnia propionica]RRD05436.1 hypothetical protein EII34_06810 [Arachnia propionica]
MKGRTIRAAAVLAASVLLLAGCSANPKQGGNEITNAKEALEQAEHEFRKLYNGNTDYDTVAEDAKCFYEKVDKESVGDMLFCGPVKELGQPGNWLRVRTFGNPVNAKLELTEFTPVDIADPTGELSRPDGAKPGNPADLADPPGPATTHKDFAVLVPLSSVPVLELQRLENPATLKQPAVTATVTASTTLERVPGEVLAALDEELGDSPELPHRPADGQQLGAWQVDIADPVDLAPKFDAEYSWDSPKEGREAGASFHVEAGGKRITVRKPKEQQSGWGAKKDDGELRFPCERAACGSPEKGTYLLVVSSATVEGATLVATTDGQTEALPLAGGDVSTDHSTILYELDPPSIDGGLSYTEKSFVAVTAAERQNEYDKKDITVTYGFKSSKAYLTAFDAVHGWSPAGEAWLVLALGDVKVRANSDSTASKDMEVAKSWSVTVDGAIIQAEPTEYIDRITFKVPATARKFQVTVTPHLNLHWTALHGSGVSTQTKDVVAPEPISFDLTFS